MSLKFASLFQQRDVRETPAGTSTSTSSTSILAPVGAIMPWLKSFTNTPQALPSGWMEADGSAISDADSVYNGQNAPDLNGGEFIRGDATSGGTGGSDTMAHTHTTNVTIDNHTTLTMNNHTALALNNDSHTHTVSGTTSEDGAHTHSLVDVDSNLAADGFVSHNTDSKGDHTHTWSDTSSQDTHAHTFSQNITAHALGQNIDAHTENNPATSAASNDENRPKYYNVVWIFRYK